MPTLPREEITRWIAAARKGVPTYFSASAVAEIGAWLEAVEAENASAAAEYKDRIAQLETELDAMADELQILTEG